MNKKLWAVFIIILLGCIWGSSFILLKKSNHIFNVWQLAGLRQFLAGVFLFPWIIYFYTNKNNMHSNYSLSITKKDYINLFLSGLIGNGIPAVCFALASALIPSAVSGIINATTPIFTIIIGTLFFGVSTNFYGKLGVAVGLIGTVIIILPELTKLNHSATGNYNYLGILLPICAAIMYGYNINLIKSKLSHLSPMIKTSFPFLFMAILYSFVLLYTDVLSVWKTHDSEVWKAFGYMCILGILGSAISMIVFNYLIKFTTALVASTNTFIIPIVAVMWGILDHETLTWHVVVGLIAIFIAIYLIIYYSNKKAKQTLNK